MNACWLLFGMRAVACLLRRHPCGPSGGAEVAKKEPWTIFVDPSYTTATRKPPPEYHHHPITTPDHLHPNTTPIIAPPSPPPEHRHRKTLGIVMGDVKRFFAELKATSADGPLQTSDDKCCVGLKAIDASDCFDIVCVEIPDNGCARPFKVNGVMWSSS